MDKTQEMGEAPLGRLLLKFSLPAIAMMVVNGLYNFIDRVFIGQGMGTEALAAVTAGFPMMIIAMAVGSLFSVGSATLVSMAMGKGDRGRARSVLGQGFAASFVSSFVVTILGWIFMDPLLRAFGTTESIMPMAREYLGIIMLGFALQVPTMAVSGSLRAQNRPTQAMIATVSGTVLNAVLAPLFIFAFHWGVAGAAWATLVAQALAAFLTFAFIQEKGSILKIEARWLMPRAETMVEMLKLGLPIALVQSLSLVLLIVANNSMSRLGGAEGLAVIGIVNALSQLCMFPVMGIVQGAQALWGYNYGAGKVDRVRGILGLAIGWTTGLGILITVAVEVFNRQLVAAFNPHDSALIVLGTRGIAIFMITFFTAGLQFTMAMYFMAIGKAKEGGLLFLARNILSIVGMGLLPLAMGIDGVYWSGPAVDIIVSALALTFLVAESKRLEKEGKEVGGLRLPATGELAV
ncbi:MAG TPA: MATE family efflux transporter [Rectinemataceae bacterium]|nr:MATE family efflux transporter [Rectinemataceae bacterium]